MKCILAALAVFMVGTVSYASTLSDACKQDIKKYSCKTDSDQEIHECLEKHEKHGKKFPTEGFKKACYDAHEAFEKQSGGTEAEEHHS